MLFSKFTFPRASGDWRLKAPDFFSSMNNLRFVILGAGCLTCFAMPAMAQNTDFNNRLNRLENEIQTLNEAMFRGKKPTFETQTGEVQKSINHISPSQTAQIEVRLQNMETEMRNLTGRIEEIGFETQQMKGQLERFMQDTELRFQDMALQAAHPAEEPVRGMNSVQITDARPDALTLNKAVPQSQTDQSLPQSRLEGYEAAFALLRQGQYEQAEAAFQNYLAANPEGNLAGNAQYWLAETYYVRGMYEQAARGFAKGYQEYPDSSKKADNLLKLSLSLARLDKTEEACVTLRQLEKDVPDAPLPIQNRADQESDRLGC